MCNVEHLATLTGWAGHDTGETDWTEAEQHLDIALPPDFQELARRFPAGTFQGFLDFQPYPAALADLCEFPLGDLRRWRDHAPDEAEVRYRKYLSAPDGREAPAPEVSYPFPLWPEPGGIYPWAEGGNDAIFFWWTAGPDPGSWPVIWCHGEDLEWEQFEGSAAGFLVALVTGQIGTGRLGAPIFPPPPRFDPWVPHTPVPRPRSS